ncbi:hypothetical protein [Eleftheria terrae]|uniref:hypothetical protein n=1 Tax=Eleftheria terrae TaxID=1597781 RepID=UPI00263A4EDC|nr:hypothetical protein [Eleftheria terrae]WKB53003.1 hypothetical protein N7L95_00950 [Eleftheria terrae]
MATEEQVKQWAAQVGAETGWQSTQSRSDPELADDDFVLSADQLRRFAELAQEAERGAELVIRATEGPVCIKELEISLGARVVVEPGEFPVLIWSVSRARGEKQ